MGFDLRTRVGWRNLMTTYKYRAYKRDWKMVFTDTVMPIVCAVIGHRVYDSNAPGSPPEWACKRCCHYVKAPSMAQREG